MGRLWICLKATPGGNWDGMFAKLAIPSNFNGASCDSSLPLIHIIFLQSLHPVPGVLLFFSPSPFPSALFVKHFQVGTLHKCLVKADNLELSEPCRELTGLTPESLAKAEPLDRVLQQVRVNLWMQGAGFQMMQSSKEETFALKIVKQPQLFTPAK